MKHVQALTPAAIPARLHAALALLGEAYLDAQEYRLSAWEFAVEFKELEQAGLSGSDFRRLVCCGYIEHAVEEKPGRAHRRFRRGAQLAIQDKTCVVLSKAGASWAGQIVPTMDKRNQTSTNGRTASRFSSDSARPRWDGELLQLSMGDTVVRQFKRSAFNQIMILAAFEEHGWPKHLKDPLPRRRRHPPKRRLHQTIANLNRDLRDSLIRFGGDGTGQGVCWKPVF